MKKIVVYVFLCLTFFSASALALPVTPFLVMGEQNQLSDDSWEMLVDNATNVGTVDEGDYIVGVLRFNSLINSAYPSGETYNKFSPNWNNELTAVFKAEVISKTGGPGAYTWELGATGTFGNTAQTLLQVYSDPTNDFDVQDPIANALATAGNGTLYWEAGITDNFTNWIVTAPVDDITLLSPLGGGPNVGTVNFGLNLLPYGIGPDLYFAQTNTVVDPTALFQIAGNGNFTAPNDNSPEWTDATDDFNAFFKPVSVVPEPATMILFGLGLLGLSGIARKKKIQ